MSKIPTLDINLRVNFREILALNHQDTRLQQASSTRKTVQPLSPYSTTTIRASESTTRARVIIIRRGMRMNAKDGCRCGVVGSQVGNESHGR
jgi:hypothetical protein